MYDKSGYIDTFLMDFYNNFRLFLLIYYISNQTKFQNIWTIFRRDDVPLKINIR